MVHTEILDDAETDPGQRQAQTFPGGGPDPARDEAVAQATLRKFQARQEKRKRAVLDDYLTEAELARELDRSKRTLERWRRLRTGPVPTICGNKVLYAVDDVRKWLRAQRQEAPHARAS